MGTFGSKKIPFLVFFTFTRKKNFRFHEAKVGVAEKLNKKSCFVTKAEKEVLSRQSFHVLLNGVKWNDFIKSKDGSCLMLNNWRRLYASSKLYVANGMRGFNSTQLTKAAGTTANAVELEKFIILIHMLQKYSSQRQCSTCCHDMKPNEWIYFVGIDNCFD